MKGFVCLLSIDYYASGIRTVTGVAVLGSFLKLFFSPFPDFSVFFFNSTILSPNKKLGEGMMGELKPDFYKDETGYD